jgi:hypothetical protein
VLEAALVLEPEVPEESSTVESLLREIVKECL